jgi:hypothetical protein
VHTEPQFRGTWALRVAGLCLGALSIASLLLYFAGLMPLRRGVLLLLPVSALGLVALYLWALKARQNEFVDRLKAGFWAGALATFAYDIVRVPIALSGTPVFKAISYFGTVILDQPAPTLSSEIAGWSYHVSNGLGFAIMYGCLVKKVRWWTAASWALLLEGAMLITPYAEVFGYRLTRGFLAITLSAHVVYGLSLWGAFRIWTQHDPRSSLQRLSRAWRMISFCIACVGIAGIAVDFHARHAKTIPPSPPSALGPNLFTTWDVLEPDRVVAMWIYQRFVSREARFHFVAPFTRIAFGTPFDTPEAETRRTGARSATEVLVDKHALGSDAKIRMLARMTHLYEISPWLIPSDRAAQSVGYRIKEFAKDCKPEETRLCAERIFAYLDEWYAP